MDNAKSKIGLLGGTFDPPHIGHLILAETARSQLGLERVLFLPVGQPTHKTSLTPAAHRVAMTALAIAGNPCFELDLTDSERPPPHYTVDLLPLLQKRWPDGELWLLLGGDSLRDLPTWHRPAELMERVRFAVLDRPGAEIDWVTLSLALPGLANRVRMLQGASVDLSSTFLRQILSTGGRARYLVPDPVLAYIASHTLYSSPGAKPTSDG